MSTATILIILYFVSNCIAALLCVLINYYIRATDSESLEQIYEDKMADVANDTIDDLTSLIVYSLLGSVCLILVLIAVIYAFLSGKAAFKWNLKVFKAENLGFSGRSIYASKGKIWVCLNSDKMGESPGMVISRIVYHYFDKFERPACYTPNSVGNKYIRAIELLANAENHPEWFDENRVLNPKLLVAKNYPLK